MKIFLIVVVAVFISSASAYAGYKYGVSKGYENVYTIGSDERANFDPSNNILVRAALEEENAELRAENERLVGDYNSMVQEANAALSSQVYQPRQSINCTTNTIGNYTYTNCN